MTCHHYHQIHRRLRGVRTKSPKDLPASSLSPAQILTAYGFTQNQFAGVLNPPQTPTKIGIGSLGGGVVQQDIDNSVAAWGMLPPNLTIRTVGGATNDPTTDPGANVENMLDIVPTIAFAWWWLTGTPADVTICFGPNGPGGMEAVTRDLVSAGCLVCSWSWGQAASQWDPNERASLSQAFLDAANAGVTFLAASGDNSIDDGTASPSADYPCADPNVLAVGGTRLVVAPDGTRAEESAWGDGNPGDEGGGGGFDPTVAMPPWQQGIVPGQYRGVPDTSANADPSSGWQMSANGSWTVVGGTSAASPFTAALVAIAKAFAVARGNAPNAGLATPNLYAAQAFAVNDITAGSNGAPASPGWDPATGLGSPNGQAFIDAIATPTQAPLPNPLPLPPQPTVAEYDAETWASQGLANNWPNDGSTPNLTDAQAWASQGLADNWPAPFGTSLKRKQHP